MGQNAISEYDAMKIPLLDNPLAFYFFCIKNNKINDIKSFKFTYILQNYKDY
jgi:hypothetical protein